MNVAADLCAKDFADLASRGATGLLVSVRNASEAMAALAGGADVIDVKEPNAGPLGAASLDAIAGVVQAVAGAVPVTAATGELGEGFAAESLPTGVAIAKLGLAGSADRPWRRQSERWAASLPVSTSAVLVAYADWQTAEAPAPEEVLSHAVEIGCRGMVFDTWSKAGGCSLDLLDAEILKALIRQAVARGMLTVLAGSMMPERLGEAASYGPTLVGVRGAACVGGRAGHVNTDRVRMLAQRLGACRRGR